MWMLPLAWAVPRYGAAPLVSALLYSLLRGREIS